MSDSSGSSDEDERIGFSSDLTVLYTPEDDPLLDIVAVENLGDSPLQSWTRHDDGFAHVWLEDADFLPTEVPNARILSFGYTLGKELDIFALSRDLSQQLKAERDDQEASSRTH
jgi:hypothetical protein